MSRGINKNSIFRILQSGRLFNVKIMSFNTTKLVRHFENKYKNVDIIIENQLHLQLMQIIKWINDKTNRNVFNLRLIKIRYLFVLSLNSEM